MYTNCSFRTWIPGRYIEVAFIQSGVAVKRGSTVYEWGTVGGERGSMRVIDVSLFADLSTENDVHEGAELNIPIESAPCTDSYESEEARQVQCRSSNLAFDYPPTCIQCYCCVQSEDNCLSCTTAPVVPSLRVWNSRMSLLCNMYM